MCLLLATRTLSFPGPGSQPRCRQLPCGAEGAAFESLQNLPRAAVIPSVDANALLTHLPWISWLQQPSLAFNILCSYFSKDLVKPSQSLFIFRMLLLAARTDLALYRRCYGFGFLAELSGEHERSHLFMRKALKSQSYMVFQGYWHYLFND